MHQINFPKIAVIGVDGFIGSNLLRAIKSRYPDAVGTSRRESSKHYHLDLNSLPDNLELLAETGHSHAIITVAEPKIDHCKDNPDASFKINVSSVIEVAKLLEKAGIVPVFLSSDRVFDGCIWTNGDQPFSEESPVKADSIYGTQKILVEKELEKLQEHLILRLSKVYGTTKGDCTMLDDIANRLTSGRQVDPPYDQLFNPIHIDDLVKGTLVLINARETGIFNLCSPLPYSRRKLGLTMARLLSKPLSLVPVPPNNTQHTPMLAEKFIKRTGVIPLSPLEGIRILAEAYAG